MSVELPTTMRASQWKVNTGGLEKNLTLNEKAVLPKNAASLPKGHTLVKVAYTSLNPFDYKVAELPIVGNYILSKPSVPALDYSGVVVDTKLPHLKPGDRVFGRTDPPAFGTLAEYVVVGPEGIAKIPEGVSLRDASTAAIAALAAYQCIVPFVKEGDEVFINGGSGGTGIFGIQFAKAIGCRVTVTCSARNVELCKRLGADEVIDYTKVDSITEELKRQGKQYDLIVDNVFRDRSLYWQCHSFVKPTGAFVTPGDTSFSALKDIALAVRLPSWLGGGKRRFVFVTNQPVPKELDRIAAWMQEGKVKTVIEEEYEMEDAAKAYTRLKSGRVQGKLVIRVAGE